MRYFANIATALVLSGSACFVAAGCATEPADEDVDTTAQAQVTDQSQGGVGTEKAMPSQLSKDIGNEKALPSKELPSKELPSQEQFNKKAPPTEQYGEFNKKAPSQEQVGEFNKKAPPTEQYGEYNKKAPPIENQIPSASQFNKKEPVSSKGEYGPSLSQGK